MAILGDFVTLWGDSPVRIGDGHTSHFWDFYTHGRRDKDDAILMLMVQGLTTSTNNPVVRLNDIVVGSISDYQGANKNHWFTQIINLAPGELYKDKKNRLLIEGVTFPGGGDNNYDDFHIKSLVVFFHQSS